MKGIGNYIKSILNNRNISNQEMAEKLGISYKQFMNILSNKNLTTVSLLKEISDILDVPTDYLLRDFGDKFIVYAIDDYLSRLNKEDIQWLLDSFNELNEIGDTDNN